jgi:myxalamid-type polyketide synthase MxaE and MxaD
LNQSTAQVAVLPIDFEKWSQSYPTAAGWPLFAEVLQRQRAEGAADQQMERTIGDRLFVADSSERKNLVENYLIEQLGRVLGISTSRLAALDVNRPVNRLGIDSLMAIEMKTRIETDLSVVIPIVNFLKGATIAQLTEQVIGQLPASSPASPEEDATADDRPVMKARAAAASSLNRWEEITL